MRYHSITQVATRMGVTRQAVWSAIKRGHIQAERIGHAWVIEQAEVDRLMQPEEITRREKFMPRKGEAKSSDDNGRSAYGRDGLTAATNRRGA